MYIKKFICEDCGVNCNLHLYKMNNKEYVLCPTCGHKKQGQIIIKDWTGKILFKGHYDSHAVNEILEANMCTLCTHNGPINSYCNECNGTGYKGDFEVYWEDENNNENVYEYINY